MDPYLGRVAWPTSRALAVMELGTGSPREGVRQGVSRVRPQGRPDCSEPGGSGGQRQERPPEQPGLLEGPLERPFCPLSAVCPLPSVAVGRPGRAVQVVGRVPRWQPEMFLVTSGPRACGVAVTAEA